VLNPRERAAHNESVRKLRDDFARGENERVPIAVTWDESLWLALAGRTFREFYTDPRVQLEVSLEGMAWCAENIVHDAPLGPPDEAWTVAPRWWMDEPECLGCEVVIQENSFAWSRPLDAPLAELTQRVRDLDAKETVAKSRLFRLYSDMGELAEGMVYQDLPVRIAFCGGTHGVFTIAARVRGEERLCLDVAQEPDLAGEFIGAVTDHTIGRVKAWHELAQTGRQFPSPDGWGMADDSLQMISPDTYRRCVLPHHQRLYAALTTGRRSMHLCGYAEQHYEALYHELGIRALDGPGPFADLGEVVTRLPELHLAAQTDHTLLITGPVKEIEGMMRNMLTDQTKQPGRYSVSAFIIADTPLEHVRAAYEAGKRHGRMKNGVGPHF